MVRSVDFKCTWWGAAGTVMHSPTGLYLYGGYGQQTIDSLPAGLDDTSTTYFLQPGIERKWHPIGKTTIFGEYRHDNPGASVNAAGRFDDQGADLTSTLAASCRTSRLPPWISTSSTVTPKVTTSKDGGEKVTIDDFDMLITGARIQF